MQTKIFYDAEFTGLQQHNQLISLALCAEDGRAFYAEFSDFDRAQCDAWIHEHVLSVTRWAQYLGAAPYQAQEDELQLCFGDSAAIKQALLTWLMPYQQVEIWADCLAWDWVLFCELFGGALHLPKQIFYMPFDLVTLFYCQGIDPDISRVEFVQQQGLPIPPGQVHNALFDAYITRQCYQLLIAR